MFVVMEILLIIFTLVVLESLLSVDNAAVLAVMVKDLPDKDQKKALTWGIWGAIILRGLCLFIASWLASQWYLKCIGGVYLCYLTIAHFSSVSSIEEPDDQPGWVASFVAWCKTKVGALWGTIILVEIMDLIFSIDNVFAAVALTNKFWIIIIGVVIGMITMRAVATWFTKLMAKYPSLETSAYIVVGLLGIKLFVTGIINAYPDAVWANNLLANHYTDLAFSARLMTIFFIPLLIKRNSRTTQHV